MAKKNKVDDANFGFKPVVNTQSLHADDAHSDSTGDPVRNLRSSLINNPITTPKVIIFGNGSWDSDEDAVNFGPFNLERSLAGMMRGSYLIGSSDVVVTTESVAKVTQDFGRIIYDFKYY
jgi:hypothetical protein